MKMPLLQAPQRCPKASGCPQATFSTRGLVLETLESTVDKSVQIILGLATVSVYVLMV